MSGQLRLSVVIDGQTKEATVAVDQVTDALKRIDAQAAKTATTAPQAIQAVGRSAAEATKLSAQQLGQMQFQLQDMEVGLTSGQSPFTVMMQQGSQLAQSFTGGTGVMAALRAIGGGIASFVTNPLDLAVLGFGIAASAAGSFFSMIMNSGGEANALLERHRKFIDDIGNSYDRMKDKATASFKAINPQLLIEAQLRGPNLEEALSIARGGITGNLANAVQSRTSVADQFRLQSEGGLDAFNKISQILADAGPKLESGAISAQDVITQIRQIGEEAPKTAIDLRRFVLELTGGSDELGQKVDGLLQPLGDAEKSLKQNEAAIRLLQGSASAADKAVLGLDEKTRSATSAIDGLARSLGAINPRGMPLSAFGPASPQYGLPGAGMNLFDLIMMREGTSGVGHRGFNETLGYGRFTGGNVELTSMTINQVLALQTKMLEQTRALPKDSAYYNSSAVGGFQIVQTTLRDAMANLKITGDMIFTPEVQKAIATWLIQRSGGDVNKLIGTWPSLKGINPEVLRSGFDLTSGERSSLADEQARAAAAERTKAAKAQEVLINKPLAAGAEAMKKSYAEIYQQQVAFTNQFRGIFDGVVTSIAQAREAGSSWTSSFGAGLDSLKDKALSILDGFISKALDSAAFGAPGTAGGGIFGSILGAFFRPTPNALGNVFSGGSLTAFATGGVVSGATLFPMRGGAGLMGEAGPEAIVPLMRSPSGHLGVRAMGGGGAVFSQTIVNNAGVQVTSRARENGSGGLDIETMIERKIDQHLAKDETTAALASRLGTRPPVRQWG